jgi:hypothetical protein
VKVEIQTDIPMPTTRQDMIGACFPVRGGFGARNGHMHIVIAATEKVKGCCQYGGYTTITVDSDGDIVGANQYAFHYFDGKIPFARCDGIEDMTLIVRST